MIARILPTIPRPARLFLLLAVADTFLFSLLRGAFALSFAPPGGGLPAAVIAKAFLLGVKFDARLAVLTVLPLLVLGGVRALSPFERLQARRGWSWYLALSHLLLFFVYAVDFGYYAYAASRVNVSILQFFYNPGTSAAMIWASYPVVRHALGLAFAAWAVLRIARLLLERASRWPAATAPRRRRVAASIVVAFVAAGAIYGKFSWYPLRWSDAHFSTSTYAADLAHNPVLYFTETLHKKPAAYDLAKVRGAYPVVAKYLGIANPDPARLVYARRVEPLGSPQGSARGDSQGRSSRPNVVIVILESFAAYKTGSFGNPLDPTPRFDALAREGTLYTRFFTPTWGTARSVWATVTGLPDVEADLTATRNPLLVSQNSILNDFAGYEKLYFLGGSLNWANIRGLLAANIAGLRLYEEGSYRAPRVDGWGISDLDLFEEANRVFTGLDRPFVAIVQTSGSHRPYTIPKNRRGFELKKITDDEARRHGFGAADEYNAFRFLDHAIGVFIEGARREPWFADTIFLFYGDHGLPGSAPHIPRGYEEAGLTHFHVPLLVYGPGRVPGGRRIDTVASELDVLPTAASLAGLPYVNSGFGRDLLDPAFEAQRYTFTVGDQGKVPWLGLIGKEYAFGILGDGSNRKLTALNDDPRTNLAAREPEMTAQMEELCRALYETARYLPFVNAPEQVRGAGR